MTRMRYRTDGSWYAECAARLRDGKPLPEPYDGDEYRAEIAATPPAEPGDTWPMHWHSDGDAEGPLAGYGICCPRCGEIHWWTTATNCTTNLVDGACEHRRRSGRLGSCWTWTGDPTQNRLSASPSLFASGPGACGWHGWLTDGELRSV